MLIYLIRRIGALIPTLIAISIVSFVIIQLPPGDYLTIYMQQLRDQGDVVDEAEMLALQKRYGLGQPIYVQYAKWIWGILSRGDWGDSMYFDLPVTTVVGDRIWLTMMLSFLTMILSWSISIPVGIFSAVNKYKLWDNIITFLAFIDFC